MSDRSLASPCGIYCGTCPHLGTQCPGCGNVQGKPFWTAGMNVEVCALYDCCIAKKQLAHCGLCDQFPCETFMRYNDPSLSEEEAQQAALARKGHLLRRKEIGTEGWLEEQETCGK